MKLFQLPDAGSLLVVGDSLTQYSNGFHLQERLGSSWIVTHRGVHLSTVSYWTPQIQGLILNAPSDTSPILVPLGTNDAVLLNPDKYLQEVYRFHAAVRSVTSARVYYFLVPPSLEPDRAENILKNNSKLRSDFPRDNTLLVDLETPFRSHPNPLELYGDGDLLHPSSEGYKLIQDIIVSNLAADSPNLP